MLAARFGLPDLGLAALGEMAAGITDIVAASDLPVMVDADDGYGDVKSVAYTTEVYVRLGVSGMILEDQMRVAKQPGDAGALALIPTEVMAQKLRVAAEVRGDAEVQIVARCDAYQPEGLQGAIRRCEQYLKAGADGVFIPGVPKVEHLTEIGKSFRGKHLVVAMFEGRPTWLPPQELHAMGFSQVVYPWMMMSRVIHTLDAALKDFKNFAEGKAAMPPVGDPEAARVAFEEAVRLDRWKAIQN